MIKLASGESFALASLGCAILGQYFLALLGFQEPLEIVFFVLPLLPAAEVIWLHSSESGDAVGVCHRQCDRLRHPRPAMGISNSHPFELVKYLQKMIRMIQTLF